MDAERQRTGPGREARTYGLAKTLYNRWKRLGAMGIFAHDGRAGCRGAKPKTVMIDATYLEARRTASSLRVKRGAWTTDRQPKCGLNTKLHAVTDADGRTLIFFMTERQVSDDTGAAALLDDLPKAQWLLGDRGYDADCFGDALEAKGLGLYSRSQIAD